MRRGFATLACASPVIPAKAGIQAGAGRSDGPCRAGEFSHWIPAFAGMTAVGVIAFAGMTAVGVTTGA
jgi:hypothetical protein